MIPRKWFLSFIIITVIIGLIACKNGQFPNDNHGITFQGKLLNSSPRFLNSRDISEQTPNSVMAITYHNSLTTNNIRDSISADVSDEGLFEIEIQQGAINCILILLDTTVDRVDQVLGYVAVIENGESVIGIPIESADSEIDLGEIDNEKEDAASDLDFAEAADILHVTLDELQERARVDDILKHVRNLYINYDPAKDIGKLDTPVYIGFNQSLPETGIKTLNTDWVFSQFTLFLFGDTSFDTTIDELIAGSNILEIFPPVEVTIQDGPTIGPDNPLTTTGLTDQSTPLYIFAANDMVIVEYNEDTREIGQMIIGFEPILPLPAGDWIVTRNGEHYGYFNIGYSTPYGNDGFLRMHVPSIEVEADVSNLVQELAINWSFYNSSISGYVEIEDLSTFLEALDWGGVSIVRYGGEDGILIDNPSENNYILTPDHFGNWTYDQSVGITIFNRRFGVDYVFDFE